MKPLSATDAVKAIEAGTLTSETLVQSCLDRIADRDPVVKAWVHLDPALALAQARAADRAKGGLLRGVPIGVTMSPTIVNMSTFRAVLTVSVSPATGVPVSVNCAPATLIVPPFL